MRSFKRASIGLNQVLSCSSTLKQVQYFFEGVWVQTTVIAAQARLYRLRRGSGVGGGGRRVQNLQHMCFHVFLCGTLAGFVRFGTWRRIHRPVRVQLTSPGSRLWVRSCFLVTKKASHSPAVLK